MNRLSFGAKVALPLALYLVAQVVGLLHTGLTDDDDFYLPAGARYADWLGDVATFRTSPFDRAAADEAFQLNHEHPPVAKYALGIAGAVFGFLGPIDGPRMATVLWSTLCAAVLIWLAVGHLGRRRGLFVGGWAAMFLLLLPRFFFHSHVGTLDVPVTATYLLAAALALFAEQRSRWVWLAGPAFGVAAATKLNGPFLILPMLVFWLLTRRRPPLEGEVSQPHLRLPALPATFFSMVVLGPLVFFALWPWLWFDTFERTKAYVEFHLNHYPIYLLYFGEVYERPFAPWHAPFVLTGLTVPAPVLFLGAVGVGFGAVAAVARVLRRGEPEDPARGEGDLLLFTLLHAAFTISVVAFSGAPKYGGVKLFLPFFPFLCLLAGYGALRLVEAARAPLHWPMRAVAPVAAVASLASLLRYGEHGLSQYNALAGGLRGAAVMGMERQYYDVPFLEQIAWLTDNAPENAKVHYLPNHWEYERTFRWYHRAEDLRPDVRATRHERAADIVIVTHERRFRRYSDDLRRYRTRPILFTRKVDGVPLWTAFGRPAAGQSVHSPRP